MGEVGATEEQVVAGDNGMITRSRQNKQWDLCKMLRPEQSDVYFYTNNITSTTATSTSLQILLHLKENYTYSAISAINVPTVVNSTSAVEIITMLDHWCGPTGTNSKNTEVRPSRQLLC